MELLERDGELATLEELANTCLAGKGEAVIVSGPVASGKTNLLNAFAERITAAGASFVSATASPAERALPFGVIGQVFYGARLPAEQARHAARLLEEGALFPGSQPEENERVSLHVLDGVCAVLLEMAQRQPLVIGVDDLHHVDAPSLHCLSHLGRQLHSVPLMVVLTESIQPEPVHPLRHAELLPHCRRIRLDLLSEQGVHALLKDGLGTRNADLLATDCHAASGGSPLLTRALIEDYCSLGLGAAQGLVTGSAFSQAFLHCLYRCDQAMVSVAQGLAVLGDSATLPMLAELMGLDTELADRAIKALSGSGLLVGGRFRHLAGRAAVLDSVAAESRAAMHAQAARLLHGDGAAAGVVAGQLIAADYAEPAWAASVLRAAAEEALAIGQVDLALAYLRLALRGDTNEHERARALAMLAGAQWRVNPSAAVRHMTELVAAVRAGHLTGRQAMVPIGWLTWFGQIDEAVDLLEHLKGSGDSLDEETATDLRNAQLTLSYLYPATAATMRGQQATQPPEPILAAPRGDAWRTKLFTDVLAGKIDDSLVAARQTLQECRLDEQAWPAVGFALSALTYGEHLSTAAKYCEWLVSQADAQCAVTWQAVLTCLRAQTALLRGDLPAAEQLARTALTLISAKGWGVLLGLPLTVLVRACTAMGRHEEALNYLRTPLPDAVFQTTIGLHYLRARGIYYRANEQFSAALTDFQSCGELMGRWGIDVPLILPWRTDAALTWLHLGQVDRARELAGGQLSQLGPAPSRVRGSSLRILAATSDPAQRPALLNAAADTLQACGDRLELAHVLMDLSQAYDALGQHSQARMVSHEARRMARQCGLTTLNHNPPHRVTVSESAHQAPGTTNVDGIAELSEAERRVAVLAIQGLTNRQVAARLDVTVSTVEQHLTKVYRKLKVTQRADLPLTMADSTIRRAHAW
jgi:DNA-binding NarL/FixJ family response regulator